MITVSTDRLGGASRTVVIAMSDACPICYDVLARVFPNRLTCIHCWISFDDDPEKSAKWRTNMAKDVQKPETLPTLLVKPKKPLEPKDARFKRLANQRVPKAIKVIGAIGNLSNSANYTYTEDQVSAILLALDKAVETVRNSFSGTKQKSVLWSI